jgi:3-isopropylmalate dehydrogenase
MKKNIAILPGDGIGPEIMAQAKKVLNAISDKYGHSFELKTGLIGAVAINQTGEPLPESTLDLCLDSDAVLLAAVGHPTFDNDPDAKVRPEQGLLGLRKALDLFINIRPVKIYPSMIKFAALRPELLEGVDLVIYRELSSGIYFGAKHERDESGYASDLCAYHENEILRIAHPAFKAARQRKKKVTLVDKANVLASSRLWRHTVEEVSKSYPDVTFEKLYVDNAAMQMVLAPNQFDVILTSNMFGDILSDLSSVLGGSLGFLPSSSIGTRSSVFEPVHGSYPTAAGKDIANPTAMILSVKLMLEELGMNEAAKEIETVVDYCIQHRIGTQDIHPKYEYSCSQMGDLISSIILDGIEILNEKNLDSSVSTII